MERTPRQYVVCCAVILIAALGLRLVAAVWWESRLPHGQRFGFPDSESYWVLGQSIARAAPYQFGSDRSRAFRTPGYPLVLSVVFLLCGADAPTLYARAVGAVLGVGVVAALMLLARQLFDARTALLAGGMAAVYPGAIGMSVFLLSEAAFCPLMVAQMICWAAAAQARDPRRGWRNESLAAVGAGLLGGAATLARPSWLLFIPFVAAIAVCSRQRWRWWRITAVMLIAFVAIMLPWWGRNYAQFHRFVPTNLQVGASLYDGWNPQATGASDMRFVAGFERDELAIDAARNTAQAAGTVTGSNDLPFEVRLDQRLRTAALTWARTHPRRVCELAWIKLWRIWSLWPNADELQSWTFRLAVAAGDLPILLAGLWGAICLSRRGWPYVLCWLPAVYFTLLHLIFVGSIRYRQPAMLLWIVLAAGVIAPWLARRQTHSPPRAVAP